MASSGQGGTWYEISPSLNIVFLTVPSPKESPPRYPGLVQSESLPRDLCSITNNNNGNSCSSGNRLDSAAAVSNLFLSDAIMSLSGRIAANYLNAQVNKARIVNQGRKYYLAGSVGFGFLNAFNAQYFVNYVNYAASDVTLIT